MSGLGGPSDIDSVKTEDFESQFHNIMVKQVCVFWTSDVCLSNQLRSIYCIVVVCRLEVFQLQVLTSLW